MFINRQPILVNSKELDGAIMQQCIQLALLGIKATKTNPLVGCVITYGEQVIGRGYHAAYGTNHAEAAAIQSVEPTMQHLLTSCTLYVTLEPCTHYGKTPPCADKIIELGIPRVVIGCLDPNENVSGNGVAKLRNAGIEVTVGCCEQECKRLIMPFVKNLQKLPYTILKFAVSQYNIMGVKGKNTWFSDGDTNVLNHRWRSEVDGILVGKNTVLADDPSLDNRYYTGSSPIRIVLCSDPEELRWSKLYNDEKATYFINTKVEGLQGNKQFIKIDDINNCKEILQLLFEKGICTLLVEGGKSILQSFITSDLWDEARVINTPHPLDEGIQAPIIRGELYKEKQLRADRILYLYNKTSLEQ